MTTGILTDSTADINKKTREKYNIEIIPLTVHFGNNVYTDGIDINPAEFFEKLKKANELPGTSRPPISLFMEKYKKMAEKYDSIISIHVSSALSGTFEAARLASRQLPEIDIQVIDSSTISLGLGFLSILTAKLIKSDTSMAKIKDIIEKAKNNMLLYFTVDELKYMKEGGRIGKARAFLGSVLNINPIISISTDTGQVLPLDKCRGKKRTMKRMVEIALDHLQNNKIAWIGMAHGDREQDGEKFMTSLLTKIKENLNLTYNSFTTRISPALGCHVGPSVYAAVILTGDFLNVTDFGQKNR